MKGIKTLAIICNDKTKTDLLENTIKEDSRIQIKNVLIKPTIKDFNTTLDECLSNSCKNLNTDATNNIVLAAVLLDIKDLVQNDIDVIKKRLSSVNAVGIPLIAVYDGVDSFDYDLLESVDGCCDCTGLGLLAIKIKRCEEILSLKQKVIDEVAAVKKARTDVIEGIATMIDYRHEETGNHIRHTRMLAKRLAGLIYEGDDRANTLKTELCKVFGIKETMSNAQKDELAQRGIESIGFAAMLHDIGKIGIPDNILLKRDNLDSIERKEFCKHSKAGSDLIEKSTFLADKMVFDFAKDMTLYHHVFVKPHKNSYPYNIEGDNSTTIKKEDIPITARIMSLVDAFDAMVNPRQYNIEKGNVKTEEQIRKEIEGYGYDGKQFDKELVGLFVANWNTFYNICKKPSK